jgi:hypothetical protein
MAHVLAQHVGREVMIFTAGQVSLPSGGQVEGRLTRVHQGVVTLDLPDRIVWINIEHIIRMTVRR